MTRIEVLLRPLPHNCAERVVCYRVCKGEQMQLVRTDFRIMEDEWDESSASVFVTAGARCEYLMLVQYGIQKDIRRLEDIAHKMEQRAQECTAMEVVKTFLRQTRGRMLGSFMREVISMLKGMGKIRTSETYESALRSFMTFKKGKDVWIEHIDSDMMAMYEAHLMERGVTKNTSSFYMRILRAVYNRAVEKGMTMQRMPFRHVYTGVDKTVKRALGMKEIRKLKAVEIASRPALAFARDMFLFSFYTRGMSFVDMAYLMKENLKDGVLIYTRRKTKQMMTVKWERCMQEIVERWGKVNSPYMLPIVRWKNVDARRQYKNVQCNVNSNLKKVAAMAGIHMPLTMYVARHSWASIARGRNVPLAVISEGMGHDSEHTTRIYLASLDNAAIDRANAMILKMFDRPFD